MAKIDLYQNEGSPHHHTRKDTRLANLGKIALINCDSFVANKFDYRSGQTETFSCDDQSWLNIFEPKKMA